MKNASDKSRERMAWFLVGLVGVLSWLFHVAYKYLVPVPQNYVLDFSPSEALTASSSASVLFSVKLSIFRTKFVMAGWQLPGVNLLSCT